LGQAVLRALGHAGRNKEDYMFRQPVHYHYLTLEQRDSIEQRLRAGSHDERALRTALERLRQPDYGVCIECGNDIAFVRLQEDPDALHCSDCARLPIKL
jgi:RNA polymerase-binding transcription factor DksA